jgi:hypothetical protein
MSVAVSADRDLTCDFDARWFALLAAADWPLPEQRPEQALQPDIGTILDP